MTKESDDKDGKRPYKTVIPAGSRETLNLFSGCILSAETFAQILIHAGCHDAILIMDDRFIERLPTTAIAARATAAERYLYMYYFEGDAYVHLIKFPHDDKEPDKDPKPSESETQAKKSNPVSDSPPSVAARRSN
jgi:hypothetical protein